MVLKKTMLRKKRTERKNWMSRGKAYRSSCGTVKEAYGHGGDGPGQPVTKVEESVTRDCKREDRTFAGAPEDTEEVSEVAEFAGQEKELYQRGLCL